MAKKKTATKKAFDLWSEDDMHIIKMDLRDLSKDVSEVSERISKLEKASVQNGVAQVFAIAAVGATALVGFHYGVPAGGVCALVGTMAAALWQLVWHKKNNKEKDLW